jgi:DNA-binding transcriptional MerR regulator
MFTVGEFSQLAQVSKRLLRYYDEIGLLKPVHTDATTGYRYYSAEQMQDLNRILALKELGLSLDQIRRMLSDHISTSEMHGMLLLKKAEIEQHLQAEFQRIRKIESRLQSIHNAETQQPLNVVIKRVPAQPVLSVRSVVETFEHALEMMSHVREVLSEKKGYALQFLICHSDGLVERDMDLEIGCLIDASSHAPVRLDYGLQLHFDRLPAVEMMATTVVQGALETIHTGYRDIGMWVERNGYRLAGKPREISLKMPQTTSGSDLVTEIQFPVEQIG